MEQHIANQLANLIVELSIVVDEFKKPRDPSRLEIASRILAAWSTVPGSHNNPNSVQGKGNIHQALEMADALIAKSKGG